MKITINSLLLILLFGVTACTKSDDNDLPIDNDGGASSGSYWPFALGNTWELANTSNANDKSDYIIHKTVNFEGKTYFQFKPTGTDADIDLNNGVREDDGIFYELHGAPENQGVKVSQGTLTAINTNLNVGQVWKDEVTLTITGAASGSIKHTNEGKILQKSASENINGKKYNNVLKSEVKKTVYNSITGITFTIIYETWLAKGVGIIYEKSTYSETEVHSYGLISYKLK